MSLIDFVFVKFKWVLIKLISSLNNKVYEYVNLKYNTKAIQILTMILRPHSQ